MKKLVSMLKEALSDWSADNAPRFGAALSYYTIFSLGPLLLIAIGIAGLVFGAEAARGEIVVQLRGLLGTAGAEAVQSMLENAHKPGAGVLATVIGAVTLFLGASGVFTELRSALNAVWDVPPPKKSGLMGALRDRLASFTMVLVVGFLLLVSLLLSTGLAAVGTWAGGLMPGTVVLLDVLNVVVSFAVITVLFAMIYRLLPDARIEWRDVWVGAVITSVLFTLGKLAIGLYLGRSSVASAYGAAGSLAVLLVWVYYAAQILIYGAELTHVYAERHGSRKDAPKTDTPKPDAAKRQRPLIRPVPADFDEDDDVDTETPAPEGLATLGQRPAAGTAFLLTALVAGAVWAAKQASSDD